MLQMEPLTEIQVDKREGERGIDGGREGWRDRGRGRDREREWVREGQREKVGEGGRGGKEGWRANLSFQYSSLRLDQMLV